MYSRYTYLFLIAAITLLSGCADAGSVPKDEILKVDVPWEEMNTDLQLSTPKTLNTFKIGDAVFIEIKVISSNQVAFERNFGAQLFIYENERWVETPNITRYDYLAPKDYIIYPYQKNTFDVGMAVVSPEISDKNTAKTVRIVLVGSIFRNEQVTNQKTAAYLDVQLHP